MLFENKARWDYRMASFLPKPLVYIVDDDDAVRDSLDAYLTLKGMNVAVFGSAQELLSHEDVSPNLLIIDVNMPEIDGFMLLETLRDQGNDAPAVLITGLGDPDTRARAERAGVAAFFDKPIDPPVLFSALTRLLTEARA
jgi:FixJ family two-component response regulator